MNLQLLARPLPEFPALAGCQCRVVDVRVVKTQVSQYFAAPIAREPSVQQKAGVSFSNAVCGSRASDEGPLPETPAEWQSAAALRRTSSEVHPLSSNAAART